MGHENIGGKRNLQWTQPEEDLFIQLMETEIRATGQGGDLKKGAWKRMENEWANKYHSKTLLEYSLLNKIYKGGTAYGTYKSIGGGIRIEPESPNTSISNDLPLKVQDESSSSTSKRKQSQTPIGTHRQKKQPSIAESMSLAMTEMTQSIKMLACDTVNNSNTPVVDGPSKARRDACKIVESMWKVGEVGDDALLSTERIFQDSTKAEM
ncbi:hypothetical protein AMTR_s00047p00175150 [Amborella trichopoda]|uniref:Myb/SANT-like domain-containing protein n=1 Tax=Amborella trichopoda TaxID=13333 RepID=U5CWV3_AMBTC|nr:hypothetical protein AMTR_s00047p00175150 [Amborella trichopoda]